jgi:cell division protein FtsQ
VSTRARPRSASSHPSAPPPPPRANRPGTSRPRSASPARRGSVRRRRLLVVLGAVVVVLAAAAYGLSVSPLLAVDTVAVRGTSHLTAAQVTAAAAVHDGDSMAWIDTGASVAGIEALPYVRAATIEREWPHTVRITVHERTPAAWIDGPAGKSLVDGTGRVLEAVDAPPAGMPQLVGAKVVPPPGGTIDARPAARVAGVVGALAVPGVASVETTDHGIVLHLAAGPEVRMGEATGVAVKVRAALAVLAALPDAPPAYVDVSVPTNPVAG